MLSIPVKAGKNSDIASPLYDYLARTYNEEKATYYFDSFNQLRTGREVFLTSATKRQANYNDLVPGDNYLRMLAIVERKFPFAESAVKPEFIWYDSLVTNKTFAFNTIHAERASVLFSYGALYSRVALELSHSKANRKDQLEMYLVAASIFDYLKEVYIKNNPIGNASFDLSEDALEMFLQMLLAQAQTVFFYKALEEKKFSSKLLSTLALGVATLYKSAHKQSMSPSMSSILASSWSNLFYFQSLAFTASFEKRYSEEVFRKADEEGQGYGTHIAWLKKAQQTCQKALDYGRSRKISEAYTRPLQGLLSDVINKLNAAVEDNNSIYLEPIPSVNSLEKVEPRVIVKVDHNKLKPEWKGPIGLAEERETDPFFGLMPVALEKAVNQFEQKLHDVAVAVEKDVNNSIGTITMTLKEANLPALIETGVKAGVDGIPDGLYARILATVSERGGVDGLKEAITKNKTVNVELRDRVEQAVRKLKEDLEAHNNNKAKYGDKWTVPAPGDGGTAMENEGKKLIGYLTEGFKSDEVLQTKVTSSDVSPLLVEISRSKQELDKLVPKQETADDDPEVEALRTKLRVSYINLTEKMAGAQSGLAEMKQQFQLGAAQFAQSVSERPDFENLVNRPSELNALIDVQLVTFSDMSGAVKRGLEGFTPLLARVIDDSHKYMSRLQSKGSSQGQILAFQRIEAGLAEFNNVSKAIDDGANFYSNLTARVTKLEISVGDHLMSRRLIADELQAALSRGNQTQRPAQAAPPQAQPAYNPYNPQPVAQQPVSQPQQQYRPNPNQPQQQPYYGNQPQPQQQPYYAPQPQPGYGYPPQPQPGYGQQYYPPQPYQPQPNYGQGRPPQGGYPTYQQPPHQPYPQAQGYPPQAQPVPQQQQQQPPNNQQPQQQQPQAGNNGHFLKMFQSRRRF